MFSDREEKIIKIIGDKKKTYSEISAKLFKEGDTPFDDSILVSNSVRRIVKKCDYHKLDWSLSKIRENHKLYIKKEKK